MSKTTTTKSKRKVKMTERVINGKPVKVADFSRRPKFVKAIHDYLEAKRIADEASARAKELNAKLKDFLTEQGVDRALAADFLVSSIEVKTARLNTKALKEEMPEVYERFAKTSSHRKLDIRPA